MSAEPSPTPVGPPVGLVVVHREQPVRCQDTVAAFLASTVAVRVVVVDNGSSADARDLLRATLPSGVELVELGDNTGFGPGANAGLRHLLAQGHEVVGVAPHDALPEPDTLALLLAALAERPRAGLVSADVGDGCRPVVDPYFGAITVPRSHDVGWEDCGHPHGTLFLARAACLEEVGLFDERYFAYGEEADLGLRARRAGWEIGIVHGARVRNPQLGGTSDAVDYLMSRNTYLLVREHFGRYKATVRLVIAVGQLAHGIVRPARRPWIFSARGRTWALLDHARGRVGPPPTRLLRAGGVRRVDGGVGGGRGGGRGGGEPGDATDVGAPG